MRYNLWFIKCFYKLVVVLDKPWDRPQPHSTRHSAPIYTEACPILKLATCPGKLSKHQPVQVKLSIRAQPRQEVSFPK